MPAWLYNLLKGLIIVVLLAFGIWVWSMRVDYCMQQSDLSWWQCALVTDGK